MAAVRQARWRVAILTTVGAVTAGVLAFVVPKTYKAEIMVAPVSSTSSGGGLGGALSSVVSQLGGIASLAGIAGNMDNKKAEEIAVLQSETLTQAYIENNQLMPVLFASKWDAHQQRWKVSDPEDTPTLWLANEYFRKKVRTVDTDAKTGLVTLTIAWKDPKLAAEWANGLVKMTNDYLRQRAIEETQRNITYLNEEASKTNVMEAKQAVYTILQSEINKEMLARGSQEYALRVVDRAFPPERPTSPRPVLWVLLGALGGMALGVMTALTRSK